MLQCMQRLCASHSAADALLSCPGLVGRLWATYACADEHLASEAGRLMGRLFSPHTARRGAGEGRGGAVDQTVREAHRAGSGALGLS